MARKTCKLYYWWNGQAVSFNLYKTKEEALKNETQGNGECLAFYWNNEVVYAATNDQPDYPERSPLRFFCNGKIRYVHQKTMVPKTIYYDPENHNDVHEDYRTYTRYRTATLYADPRPVGAYGGAQELYNIHPDWFSATPFNYTVEGVETRYRTVPRYEVYFFGAPTGKTYSTAEEADVACFTANMAAGFVYATWADTSYQEPYQVTVTYTYTSTAYEVQVPYTVYDASKIIYVEY